MKSYRDLNIFQEGLELFYCAHASCLETLCHIEKIKNLYPLFEKEYSVLYSKYDFLGAKVFRFIQYVEKYWRV